MLRSYLLSIARSINRSKGIVVINVFGFAVSLACCILIGTYVRDELSYDRHNKNFDRIYRVGLDRVYPERNVVWARIAPGTLNGLIELPDVEAATRVSPVDVAITAEGKKGFDEHAIMVDTTFGKIFTLEYVAGDSRSPLKHPMSVILTETAAAKYFPGRNPVGKTVTLDGMGLFNVAAVIKDFPAESHFHFSLILPLGWNPREDLSIWGSNFGYFTYVLLAPHAERKSLEDKLPGMSEKYLTLDDPAGYPKWRADGNDYRFFLQPLKDIHLKSNLKWEAEPNGSYSYLLIFGGTGLLILAIACINFMNLSTARYSTRAREVGIRKILGSHRRQLIMQFMIESVSLSVLAIVIATFLAELTLPAFNQVLNKHLIIDVSSPGLLALLAVSALLVGLLSGSYPAVIFSSFRPVHVLGSGSGLPVNKSGFRNKLVVLQFVISFFLIVATLIVFSQLNFMLNKDLGIVKESVIIIDHANLIRNKESFKQEIARRPEIISSGYMSEIPGKVEGAGTYRPKGLRDQQQLNMALMGADADMTKTLGIRIVKGRALTETDYTDTSRYVLLNEKAVQLFNWPDDPVGKELIADGSNRIVRVAGVVNDFHLESLHHEVRPLMIFPTQNWAGRLSVKLQTKNLPATIAFLESKWKEFVPDRPFTYVFLDSFYDNLYQTDKTLGRLFVILAGLAIVIASLGLLGLSVFMAEQRMKEIGIRKVVGATVPSIVFLLIRDLSRLIIFAMVIATPVSWYLLHGWLQGFAYRIDISLAPFVAAAVVTLVIAVLTISFQAGKAALVNPVKVLRNQ